MTACLFNDCNGTNGMISILHNSKSALKVTRYWMSYSDYHPIWFFRDTVKMYWHLLRRFKSKNPGHDCNRTSNPLSLQSSNKKILSAIPKRKLFYNVKFLCVCVCVCVSGCVGCVCACVWVGGCVCVGVCVWVCGGCVCVGGGSWVEKKCFSNCNSEI